MNILSYFTIGSALLNVVQVAAGEKVLKAAYPEDFLVYKELGKHIGKSRLMYQGIPGSLGYVITRINKIFSEPEFRCAALLNPEAKTVSLTHLPQEAVFVNREVYTPLLSNWINSCLPAGKFHVLGKTQKYRKDGFVQFAFTVSIDYEGVESRNLALLENLFKEAFVFSETFTSVLGLLSDGKVLLNQEGIFTGKNANETVKKFSAGMDKMKGNLSPDGSPRVLERLARLLRDSQVTYQEDSEARGFQIANDNGPSTTIYVTVDEHIVTETCSPSALPPEKAARVVTSDYMVFSNTSLAGSGNFHINPTNGKMVYRVGLNIRGHENQLAARLVQNMIKQQRKIAPRLSDFWYAAEVLSFRQIADIVQNQIAQTDEHQAIAYRGIVSDFMDVVDVF